MLGMQVTRDREKGTLTISQEDYTKSILARSGMENCKPSSIPGTGSELSTEQPAETLLNTEQTQIYQAITGSVMYLAQITRYDAMYAVCQLARAKDDVEGRIWTTAEERSVTSQRRAGLTRPGAGATRRHRDRR